MKWWERFGCTAAVLLDFEFGSLSGENPEPRCLVVSELPSGVTQRIWLDGVTTPSCPFSSLPDTLFVAYFASAELGCMNVLGWPMPEKVLDLYTEFRALTNGLASLPAGNGLIGALTFFGLRSIESEEKEEMRALALRGGQYSSSERNALLDYCESDVVSLLRLAPKLVERIDHPKMSILRGRYMNAVASMETNGIPVDAPFLSKLKSHWPDVKAKLIEEVAKQFDVFEGRVFKQVKFEKLVQASALNWPRLPSGKLDLKDETFKEMSNAHPWIRPLYDVRVSLGQMRLNELPVGRDGRNRSMLSPFRSKTGRNQPSNAKFMFGPSAWLRSAIKPAPGMAVSYIDYSQQEIGVAAALSGDERLMGAYTTGDPYLTFAKQAGAVPEHATKSSHPTERELFKATTLAVNYLMGPESLAKRIGRPLHEARELLRLHRQTYRQFWRWSEAQVASAQLSGQMSTCYGWKLRVDDGANVRSLANFPMQAHGAEILRVACILGVEAGIRICAPVHDAVLIEGPSDEIESLTEQMQEIMANASAYVLNGFRLGTDSKIVKYPERYVDGRGAEMWRIVNGILDSLDEVEVSSSHNPQVGSSEVSPFRDKDVS